MGKVEIPRSNVVSSKGTDGKGMPACSASTQKKNHRVRVAHRRLRRWFLFQQPRLFTTITEIGQPAACSARSPVD